MTIFILVGFNVGLLIRVDGRVVDFKDECQWLKDSGAEVWDDRFVELKSKFPEPLRLALDKFNETLITTAEGQKRSTTPITQFFSDKRAIDDIGLLFFHAENLGSLPSMMTTIGMLGTFVGVSQGLGYISGADIGTEVGSVISGLATAFWTSILGLVSSLVFNFLNERELGRLHGEFDELRAVIAKTFPLVTPQEVLVDIRADTKESRAFLQEITDQLADKIGQKFGKSIEEILLPSLQGLTQAVEEQVTNAASSSVESARNFTSELADHLTGEIKGSFADMSASVTQFGGEFGSMTSSLKDIIVDMNHSAEKQRELLQQALEANDAARAGHEDSTALVDRMPSLLAALEKAQSNAAEMQSRQAVQTESHANHIHRISSQFSLAAEQYAQTASQLRDAMTEVSAHVSQLATSVDSASRSSESAGEQMQSAANALRKRMQKEDELISQLMAATRGFSKAFGSSEPALRGFTNIAQEVVEQLSTLRRIHEDARTAAGQLRDVSTVMSQELTKGAQMLGAAGESLEHVSRGTNQWAAEATTAVEHFGTGLQTAVETSLKRYDQSLSSAVTSLDGAIKSLTDLVEEVADSTTGAR